MPSSLSKFCPSKLGPANHAVTNTDCIDRLASCQRVLQLVPAARPRIAETQLVCITSYLHFPLDTVSVDVASALINILCAPPARGPCHHPNHARARVVVPRPLPKPRAVRIWVSFHELRNPAGAICRAFDVLFVIVGTLRQFESLRTVCHACGLCSRALPSCALRMLQNISLSCSCMPHSH